MDLVVYCCLCAPTHSKTCELWYNHDSVMGLGPVSLPSSQSCTDRNGADFNLPYDIPSAAKVKSRAMFHFNTTLAKHPSCMLTTEERNTDKEYRYYELIIEQKIHF